MIRLLATVVGAAFLLAGCSTEEGNRAQELLQQAEQAQTQLHSATFEVDLGAVVDGKQIDVAVFDAVKAVGEGRFRGGLRVFGLAEGGVDYVYDGHNRELMPPGARERVESLRAEIVAGRIEVPWERRR